MAAFFPRNYNSEASFNSLFRLLDDFDNYARAGQNGEGGDSGKNLSSIRTFQPKFDVRETEDAFELHGELPGLEKDKVAIEFTEPQTMVIKGRVERIYTAGAPPAGLGEGGDKKTIADGHHSSSSVHKATVEEDENERKKQNKSSSSKVVTATAKQQLQEGEEQQRPKERLWVSERSVGSFARTFQFPTRVNQEGVQASLKDGILNVKVPKVTKAESRRITIN